MPSYEEYAAYHPILIADINQLKRYLGAGYSPAYIHLVNVLKSLNEEYKICYQPNQQSLQVMYLERIICLVELLFKVEHLKYQTSQVLKYQRRRENTINKLLVLILDWLLHL